MIPLLRRKVLVLILLAGLIGCALVFATLLFFPAGTVLGLGKAWAIVAYHALLGWCLYPLRVVPQVTASRSGITTGLVCLVLFSAGLHYYLRWFYAGTRGDSSTAERRVWRLRWSVSIVSMIVLAFIIGIAAVVITHQTAWLLNSDYPLVKHSRNEEVAKFDFPRPR